MEKIKITELDHIVLNVGDIDRSLKFYTEVLELKGERVDEFRAGKVSFPSVRINERTIIDLFPRKDGAAKSTADKVNANLNHFCLVVGAEDFAGIVDYLAQHRVTVREGPVSRWGARGRATSVYFPDPDGNEVEIRCY
ncbi:MAG: VOC family virulence protein [Deltaproteobacteria bacterium]|nr:VOC family virulence protein [Deltaproteobacteria bacterium]